MNRTSQPVQGQRHDVEIEGSPKVTPAKVTPAPAHGQPGASGHEQTPAERELHGKRNLDRPDRVEASPAPERVTPRAFAGTRKGPAR